MDQFSLNNYFYEVDLIGAAFDQDVSLAFIDDGVFQLKKEQDTAEIYTKNFSKIYSAVEMYDVEKLYVDKFVKRLFNILTINF